MPPFDTHDLPQVPHHVKVKVKVKVSVYSPDIHITHVLQTLPSPWQCRHSNCELGPCTLSKILLRVVELITQWQNRQHILS